MQTCAWVHVLEKFTRFQLTGFVQWPDSLPAPTPHTLYSSAHTCTWVYVIRYCSAQCIWKLVLECMCLETDNHVYIYLKICTRINLLVNRYSGSCTWKCVLQCIYIYMKTIFRCYVHSWKLVHIRVDVLQNLYTTKWSWKIYSSM